MPPFLVEYQRRGRGWLAIGYAANVEETEMHPVAIVTGTWRRVRIAEKIAQIRAAENPPGLAPVIRLRRPAEAITAARKPVLPNAPSDRKPARKREARGDRRTRAARP